jgi:NADH-quinone oxidoreductase subunit L
MRQAAETKSQTSAPAPSHAEKEKAKPTAVAATAGAPEAHAHAPKKSVSAALKVITWTGVITALFAASIAVAQTDIKRILAYSTVSQLGFMMMGLGAGGVAVGMFHLITHAFFKALLFMGAGSVIHGCHEEQDIRFMGALKDRMRITFLTYAAGMLALSGFPLFAGFWSKDGILEAGYEWSVTSWPFYLGVISAILTAFYMTRQVCYVFFGNYRGGTREVAEAPTSVPADLHQNGHADKDGPSRTGHSAPGEPHESPPVMTIPLVILAVFAVLLGFAGTPAWPWFQDFLAGYTPDFEFSKLREVLSLMLLSVAIAIGGIGLGWFLYGRKPLSNPEEPDILERFQPDIFTLLRRKYFVDELYESTAVRLNAWFAKMCDTLDYLVWNGIVQLLSLAVVGLAWCNRVIDEQVINSGFDEGCRGASLGGRLMSRLQDGRVQNYLRVIGISLTVLVLLLIWGCRAS